MKNERKTIDRFLCFVLVMLLCVTGASAAAIGTSQGAMSPRVTSQSYGARLQEVPLGSYVADGMRSAAGTDIAIECGGHLVKALPGGEVTEEDARAVFAGDLDIAVVELTPAMLFDLLEHAVGYGQINEEEQLDKETGFDGFPQISGFSFEFDVSQLPGRRLRAVTLDDGRELSRGDDLVLTAALPVDMLDGSLGFDMLKGLTYEVIGTQSALLIDHIREQGQITAPARGRITMQGFEQKTIYEKWNVGLYLPYVILLILLFRLPWRNKRKRGASE